MSKVILFRGKSINTGNWVYGVPITSVNDKCYMVHGATEDAINTPNEVDFIFSEIDENTIGQYVGFTDKNEKKIFEGDDLSIKEFNNIAHDMFKDELSVRFKYSDEERKTRFEEQKKAFEDLVTSCKLEELIGDLRKEKIGVVKYDEYINHPYLFDGTEDDYLFTSNDVENARRTSNIYIYEILGNIHDNPELLEASK